MGNTKILVADDSRTIRLQAEQILRAAGYDVVVAKDGGEAVEQVKAQRPHLVVLDIQMPVMDGYEACERILEIADLDSPTRIVFLTSERGYQLEQLGRLYGAYLPKPVNGKLLLETIEKVLAQSCGDTAELAFASG